MIQYFLIFDVLGLVIYENNWTIECSEEETLTIGKTVYLQPHKALPDQDVEFCNGTIDWNIKAGEVWRHDNLCGGVALSAEKYKDVEFRGSFSPIDGESSHPSWDWSGFLFGYEDPGHFYIVIGPRNVETLPPITTAPDCHGQEYCCTSAKKCTIGQGQCSFSSECQDGLRCGSCTDNGFNGDGNCCFLPPDSTTPPSLLGIYQTLI